MFEDHITIHICVLAICFTSIEFSLGDWKAVDSRIRAAVIYKMGDGTEVVVKSHGEETKKFPEDEQVAKNELVGSDKTRDDNEDEVFEEAIDSEIDEQEGPESDNDGLQENFPLEETLQSSKDGLEVEDYEEAVGNLDEMIKNDGGVKDLMPDNSIVGEDHGEVNAEESEFDFVTPRMNGGKEEAENSLGQIESSLDVVEKADSNGPISDAEDVNIENGKTHSSLKNEIVFPEKNKELVAEVVTESHGSEEPLDDGIEAKNWEEIVDGIRTEQVAEEGEGTTKNLFEKRTEQEVEVGEGEFKNSFQDRSVCINNGSEAKINGETGADCTRNFVKNTSGVTPVNDSVGVVSVETVSPFEKSSSEEEGETEGDRNCWKTEHDLAYSLNQNIESTEIHNNSGSPGVTCREQETDQNTNGQRDVQQSPQPSKELEKQQNSSVIIDQEIKENSHHVDRESDVVTSGSPTESRSNPAALPCPAGLGRAAPLLEPATRVPQQSRVNGNISHNQNAHVDRESDVVASASPTESRSNPAALPCPAGLGRAAPLLEPATRVPQQSRVNGNVSHNQNPHVDRESDVVASASPTESRSNPAALPRPAGLGRAAPLLEPATRVPQQSRVNGNVSHNQNSHVDRESDVVTSASPTESRSNPAALPRPAGLGRAAPLLEPATRVPQQSRVNGNVSHNQPQQAEDSTIAETDEHDETREKLQLIRVKFLRLAHRLGQTPHNVVVAEVLYRLGLAEQLRGRSGSRVGAFSFDRASAMAEQLEAAGQDRLDFSCTIMVLGKSGVGKSATINSIFDEMKLCTDAFQSRTKRVQDVEGFVQGIKVRVIDTPGLLPSWSDQAKNEKILKSVKAFIKKNPPDIVLYIDRLDMQSRDSGDMPLLRTISNVFGPSIWFNAIVGLTHAASVPPDGPNGTASNYEMFITQRSQVIQQAIRQAAGDMRFMNPVSLIENHSACRTNRAGQRVLPNGQVWKPHLLLLSFASKILAEANALLKLQDNIPGTPFAARSKAPPLPFLLSSFLQSRPQPKLPEQQYGDDDEDDLNELSDSDESEYDQLPPFKRLTKAQMATLSRPQKKQYLDEMEYREKLFMKKQMKEERKRRKMFKKIAAEIKDFPDGNSENLEDESGGPASIPVPMPDLPLPASFDSDNPTHRYRYLDSSNKWLVRPVLETHGWDHDTGYEGVNAERLFVVKEKIPISFSGQVTKDKKDANVQLEMASSVKHGECKSTSLGFDMQTIGKELAYTLRSETRFNNFRKNKAAAGLSVTLLGDSVSAGLKVEDKLIVNKWFRMVMSGGAMTSRGDVAYGGSLEAQLRDKDYPLGRFLTTLGLSVMDWHGDLAIGGNIQSQVPIGRSSNLIARANLNNRGTGQLSVRVNSSEQLQLALVALVPLFKKLLYSPQTQY